MNLFSFDVYLSAKNSCVFKIHFHLNLLCFMFFLEKGSLGFYSKGIPHFFILERRIALKHQLDTTCPMFVTVLSFSFNSSEECGKNTELRDSPWLPWGNRLRNFSAALSDIQPNTQNAFNLLTDN